MSLVTASWTMPSIERLTQVDILKMFLRESNLGFYSTVSAGSVSELEDLNRLRASSLNSESVNGYLYILRDAGGSSAAPEGEIRPVESFEKKMGRINIDPPFSAPLGANDEYAVFYMTHPQDVLDHLNHLLKNEIYLPAWSILTNVPDGDMEQPNTADWSSTNATVTKSTNEPGMSGVRYLRVLGAGSSNGYARSNFLSVHPGEKYHLSALVRVEGTAARLILYDENNGVEIAAEETSASSTVRLWLEASIPEGCNTVSVRLSTPVNGETSYWDDVCFFGLEALELPLPWWVRDSDQVHGVYELRPANIKNEKEWDPALRGERDVRWDRRDEAFGRGQLRIGARFGQTIYPMFIKGTRNETAFANNTEVKHLDPVMVNAGLCYKVFSSLSGYRSSGALNMDWVREQRGRWQQEWEKQLRLQALRLEQEETAPAVDTFVYRPRHTGDTYYPRAPLVR